MLGSIFSFSVINKVMNTLDQLGHSSEINDVTKHEGDCHDHCQHQHTSVDKPIENITILSESIIGKTLSVTIPPAIATSLYAQTVREVSQHVIIGGFRKGKAPMAMILQQQRHTIDQHFTDLCCRYVLKVLKKQFDVYKINITEFNTLPDSTVICHVILQYPVTTLETSSHHFQLPAVYWTPLVLSDTFVIQYLYCMAKHTDTSCYRAVSVAALGDALTLRWQKWLDNDSHDGPSELIWHVQAHSDLIGQCVDHTMTHTFQERSASFTIESIERPIHQRIKKALSWSGMSSESSIISDDQIQKTRLVLQHALDWLQAFYLSKQFFHTFEKQTIDETFSSHCLTITPIQALWQQFNQLCGTVLPQPLNRPFSDEHLPHAVKSLCYIDIVGIFLHFEDDSKNFNAYTTLWQRLTALSQSEHHAFFKKNQPVVLDNYEFLLLGGKALLKKIFYAYAE
jgi:Bacterial trigger factor protein (TF)